MFAGVALVVALVLSVRASKIADWIGVGVWLYIFGYMLLSLGRLLLPIIAHHVIATVLIVVGVVLFILCQRSLNPRQAEALKEFGPRDKTKSLEERNEDIIQHYLGMIDCYDHSGRIISEHSNDGRRYIENKADACLHRIATIEGVTLKYNRK